MKLQNVTMVVLKVVANNGLAVGRIIENPEVPRNPKTGLPVIGPMARRLLTVKEIQAKTGLSKNKAQEARRSNPLGYLVSFGSLEDLAVLVLAKAG